MKENIQIIRDDSGRFAPGGTGYWIGTKGIKEPNSGSFFKGFIPWNKGKKKVKTCFQCGKKYITKQSKGRQKFCSYKCFSINRRGTKAPWFQGSRNPKWKGGVTSERDIMRHSPRYILWRKSVFKRDNYTCQKCGKRGGGYLVADHIKPQSIFPELRYVLSNGRTLCRPCDKLTPTYLNPNLTREMFL